MELTRRQSLQFGFLATLAATGLSLTSCSTGAVGSDTGSSSASAASDSFPVTIKHAFGETVIAAAPQRPAAISWVNADVLLALGVVPVGMPKVEFGGTANGSTPWKDEALEKLGAALGSEKAPVLYSEVDGVNFTELAKTNPDIILAAYSGITAEDYDKLSKIAPVVAYPDGAFDTSWQVSTTMIGAALGKSAAAKELVASTEATIAEQAAKYPDLAGKTFIYGNVEQDMGKGVNVYTSADNRPKFLMSLGMVMAPVILEAEKGQEGFYLPWSAEKANELEAQIFLTWVKDAATKDAIAAHPLLGQIPAIKSGAFVADSDNTLTVAISAASPLSLPWALDAFLPQLGEAAAKV